MARGIQAGDKAPDFILPSQTGEPVRLSERLGEHSVVLYFYPKDETRGCTAEACAFRDSHETFTELLGRNTLSSAERVLRIYSVSQLASEEQRDRMFAREAARGIVQPV